MTPEESKEKNKCGTGVRIDINQWDRIERLDINPYIYWPIDFQQRFKIIQWERMVS